VTVKAPPRSRRRRSVDFLSAGSTSSAIARTTSPIATFTAKTPGHPAYWVISPPITQPLAPPAAATAVHQPTARRRASPGSLSVVSRASAAGDSSAAPAPWSTRNATSASGDHARVQPADAAENRPRPIRKILRRPATSASRPPQINNPPNTSVYAVNTHCRSASLNSSPSRMAGKAMTTMVTSRITMN
jgi:hypothetical protein